MLVFLNVFYFNTCLFQCFTSLLYINQLVWQVLAHKIFFSKDPDAPVREGKSLHDLDQEDEYKLTEYIYSFVRSGELNAARDFCFKIGQSWRAATLEGFKLFNDRNFFSTAQQLQQQQDDDDENNFTMMPSNNQVFLNEGNFNRDIWRLMIQRLIKDVCLAFFLSYF